MSRGWKTRQFGSDPLHLTWVVWTTLQQRKFEFRSLTMNTVPRCLRRFFLGKTIVEKTLLLDSKLDHGDRPLAHVGATYSTIGGSLRASGYPIGSWSEC
jgi:hypothetical protein